MNSARFEAKLGEEFLMSSLFTVAEVALADLGRATVAAPGRDPLVHRRGVVGS